MTKSTTRKAPAKKAGSSTKSKTAKAAEPMEASSKPPAAVGTPATNTVRVCWAAKTLVEEFTDLFPETPVEYSNPDGRNTMLDVTFDLTVLDDEMEDAATALLELIHTDVRVNVVLAENNAVLVSFKSSARTQDNRDSFGLADAWDVLTDGEEFDEPSIYAGTIYENTPNLVLDFTDETEGEGSL